ncbi:MAG: hypothetical protein NTY64_01125, partial [Deltaproteobacteria bacterium]|nr:hypothetical protein [Deltaproteobacteria bacterium]
MTKSLRTILSVAGIATLLFCVGCMGAVYKNYGQITPDEKVTKAFESYQLKSDFNYFISGSDVYPSALIGLDKTYT